MSLTPTRYRRQSTLTFLATSLATVNAELARLEARCAKAERARLPQLRAQQEALMETIRQFDPELAPSLVGALSPPKRKGGTRTSRTAK